jgi:hypothetical protein
LVFHHALAGRIGAHVLHSRVDPLAITAAARRASGTKLDAQLLAEIDAASPGLPEAERQRRLQHARRAHFSRLALKAAQARRRKASSGLPPEDAPRSAATEYHAL